MCTAITHLRSSKTEKLTEYRSISAKCHLDFPHGVPQKMVTRVKVVIVVWAQQYYFEENETYRYQFVVQYIIQINDKTGGIFNFSMDKKFGTKGIHKGV